MRDPVRDADPEPAVLGIGTEQLGLSEERRQHEQQVDRGDPRERVLPFHRELEQQDRQLGTATDPTILLRRPRVYIDESRQLALDRGEFRRLLDAARPVPAELALVALLGLLGLRVSEAIGARIEDLGVVIRGKPTLKIVGKGGTPATIPLPERVHEMLLGAVSDRTHGPIVLRPKRSFAPATPYTRHAAALMLERLCRAASIDKHITPHSLRHTFVTLGLDAGIPLRDMQVAARHSDPRVTARYDRGRHDFDTHANHRIAEALLDE